MNLKHIGVECKLIKTSEFLQIYINSKVEASLVYRSLLKAAGDITQRFANIRSCEFHTIFSQQVR